MLEPDDIRKAYERYYTHSGGDDLFGISEASARRYETLLARCRQIASRVTGLEQEKKEIAAMFLTGNKPGKLLDVGCGAGMLLHEMHTRGWIVEGLDIDAKAVESVRQRYGFTVHEGTLEQRAFSDETFDAITASHVIEHVSDPSALLKECERILAPGGTLVVTTPNWRSLGQRIFGRNWVAWDQPRHLHIFSHGSLETCARRANFAAVQIKTTAANAAYNCRASLEIRESGKHHMLSGKRRRLHQLQAHFWQLAEALLIKVSPDQGEELILQCRKNHHSVEEI